MDRFESAAAAAARQVPGITSIHLFGSFAEGQEDSTRIAVLLDWKAYPSEAAREECARAVAAELLRVGLTHDAVVLNDLSPITARDILNGGRRLFCSNTDEDYEFLRRRS